MSSTRGTALLGRIDFLKHKDRLDVLQNLSPKDKLAIEQALPVGLYPITLKEKLDWTIATALTPHDLDATYKELGRWSAESNFIQYHGMYLRPGDPHGMMANGPAMHRRYYDSGEATYERTDSHSGVFSIHGVTEASWPDCLGTAGYWEKAVELSGGRYASVSHTACVSKGAPQCTFVVRWA